MRSATPPENLLELRDSMTLDEKIGLLLVARSVTGPDGTTWEGRDSDSPFGFTPTTELITERHISHLTLMNPAPIQHIARWGEEIRALAATTRLQMPVTLAADPMYGRTRNAQVGLSGSGFTTLTEPIGLAATHDLDLVRDAAHMIGTELRAAGLRLALHPMADLATEPRWSRIAGTFGEDPAHAAATVVAYIEGLQSAGVIATVKHFPGGGPQVKGIDAHFAEGAHTTYPGAQFDTHLAPFAAAIAAGAIRVMPGYAAPLHEDLEAVGFAFQKALMTDLLRERLGFSGVVITDFNVVDDMRLPRLGISLPVRAWGLLDLSPAERAARLFDAGVDQLGGEDDPGIIREALERGLVSEERINTSVDRVLAEKAHLGLFVDPSGGALPADKIREVVGVAEHHDLARRVQLASVVSLRGDARPLAPTDVVYVEGLDARALPQGCTVTENPAEASYAILRLSAPYDPADNPFEAAFHRGSLEFPTSEADRIAELTRRVPTVIDVFLDRPAVLTPFAELPVTLLGSFGVDDQTIVDIATQAAEAGGRLPFDLPRSMAAVEAAREDVPFDTADPLFRFGYSLVQS